MKDKIITLLMILAVLCSACEKELDFKGVEQETENDIIINALAVEGTPFKVMVSRAYQVGKTPDLNMIDYYSSVFLSDDASTDYQNNKYYLRTAILDADVQAVVNGNQTYHLTLADDSLGFVCDYIPQINDHIVVNAKYSTTNWNDGTVASIIEASAEATVPVQPKIEVLKYEVLPDNPYKMVNNISYETDTIMRITCRITDTAENKYYRLRVRGVISDRPDILVDEWFLIKNTEDRTRYIMQDIFFSDDPLFLDNRLNSGFGGWPAFFSNVFNDELLKDGDYTFVVDSPKPVLQPTNYEMGDMHPYSEWVEPQVIVELQAITPEFYRYMKSVELYRVSTSDAFSEPVQIYSNVKDGWGIFGGLSYQRVFLPY
jgi:hypothetical protein